MPFDPALPANSSTIIAAELRGQFNALKALIDTHETVLATLTEQLSEMSSVLAGLSTRMTALETTFPTALEIAALSYDVGPLTMQVTYAENGGDHAVEQTLVWWAGTGSPNRTPLVRPVQDVSMAGFSGMLVFFQTEVRNAVGVAVVSGVRSYFVD
jgi:hypothetical protein